MRTFFNVPKLGSNELTLERSRKLFRFNQATVLLSFVGVIGGFSWLTFTGAKAVDATDTSQELSRLRLEVNELTYENAMLTQRSKAFREEFNQFQVDFATMTDDMDKISSKKSPNVSDLGDIQADMSDLSFAILGLESNLQYMETRVSKSNPKGVYRAMEKLSMRSNVEKQKSVN
ncbi:MAG: hypothetical protein K8R88_00580 [Armatimonadetes bacterium]|nr:hypothetical protein [Armatimonadota bacterium]